MAYGVVVSDAILVLREWLVAAQFKPGARLPSERVLVGQFGLKHNAINRAMSRLISEGVVVREGYKLFYAGVVRETLPVAFSVDLVLGRRSLLAKSYRKIAKELGVALRMHTYESIEEALGHLHMLDQPGTQSVLFDPPHGPASSAWAPALSRLIAHGIPAVSIRQECANLPCVLADYPRALDLVYKHLSALGHVDIALITTFPRAPLSIEIHDAWKALDWKKSARPSAARVAFYDDVRGEIPEIAVKLAGPWKNVTAVVVHADHLPVVPHLIEELARLKRHVPKDLSIISLNDLPHLIASSPGVSTTAFDLPLMLETAFRLAQRLARKKDSAGPLQPAPSLRVQPYLILRDSTAPVTAFVTKKKVRELSASAPAASQSGEDTPRTPLEFRRELKAMLKRPYSLTATAEASRFVQVDLAPFVNRPLNFRKGWLGDLPLKHMDPGRHVLHGVHFDVLGGHRRQDCGAVVFRSATNTTGNARALPVKLRIPLRLKTTALYVLHGCGYARFLQPFATYDFYAGKRQLGSLPLVSLGFQPPDCDATTFQRQSLKANVQDWWPDFPHIDFLHARRAPIVESDGDETLQSHVYLYTLEWVNPQPEIEVTHMEITVDPEQVTTLGVLAISALLKKPV